MKDRAAKLYFLSPLWLFFFLPLFYVLVLSFLLMWTHNTLIMYLGLILTYLPFAILPLLKPSLLTAFIIVFIPTLGEYLVPEILGGSKKLYWGQLIAEAYLKWRDWPVGSVFGLVLIFIILFYFPLLFMMSKAFVSQEELSLIWFRELFQDPTFWEALKNSLMIASLSSVFVLSRNCISTVLFIPFRLNEMAIGLYDNNYSAYDLNSFVCVLHSRFADEETR